jgi:hypothetical protein
MNVVQKKNFFFCKKVYFVVNFSSSFNFQEGLVFEKLDADGDSGDYKMNRTRYLVLTESKLSPNTTPPGWF